MAEHQLQVDEVFDEALRRAAGADRARYLDEACGGDPELRQRVDRLLRAVAEAGSFLEAPAQDRSPTVDQPPVESPGTVIGPYKLLEPIGEGGMGTVWMAQQQEPIKRLVAVKLIKAGMDSKQVVARFEAERQALALMDHPHIARVLDGGTTSAGRPYFVMDLVKGVPITKYCDEHHLTPRQRLELFVPVCQAIQHAHQKGIIHRDLKPSNVLVALYDGKPVPKVIDFGVAKAAGQPLTEQTLVTGFGAIVGTLEYMSPEQAEINQLDVDTRSDIYSLGVLLYELLAGSPPFSRKELEKAGMLEMLRVIREQEPSKPSTKLSSSNALPTLSANRGTEPAKLTKLVRGELDWIVMKALEKDRNRRYETANGFAMDLQRYLADEAVQACPPSAAYRLRKFLRRNKGPVGAAGLVLASLVLGIIGTSIGMWRAEQRRVEAAQAKDEAVTEKKKAEAAEERTLAEFRASTDDAIEELIGSKPALGPQERTYLEKTMKRWQAFAARQGDDERNQAIRAEGHARVAYLWQKLGRHDEARREYEAARDLQKKLADAFPAVPEYQRELAGTHNNFGVLLAGLGQQDEARREYEAARDLQKKLADVFPAVPKYQRDLANTHNNLGLLLRDLGQRDEVRREFEAARDLRKKLADAFPAVPEYQQGLASAHNSLGVLLAGLGQRDEARRVYEAARDLQKKLADAFPAVPEYQRDLARTHNNLGDLLGGIGQRDKARRELEAARDLQKKLADAFPAVPEYRRDLARTHNNLGLLLRDLGQRDEARREYEAARDLRKKLADVFPAVPEYKRDLANSHNYLGALLAGLGQLDGTRSEFEAARDLHKKLADAFPAVPEYQVSLGGSYCNLGNVIFEKGQPADSLTCYDLAIRTLTPIHEKEHRDATARQFLRNSHWGRARAYSRLKKHAEALKDWDRAIELSPKPEQSGIRIMRAIDRIHTGQVVEGVAEIAELTKTSGWAAGQWYDFACAYAVASGKIADRKQEYADRAMELLRHAVKAGWKNASHMKTDVDLDPLREREDFKKLLAELENKKK